MEPIKNTIFVYEKFYNQLKKNPELSENINEELVGFEIISNPFIRDGYAHVYDGEGNLKTIYIGLVE